MSFDPAALPLHPPLPERCLPPVYVRGDGVAVPDPRRELGLPEGPITPDEVRAAWRQALLDRPPERDPRGAELAREARDRLLNPDQLLDRELGVLHVPDPRAWGLIAEPPSPLTSEARLLGQLALYCLVEEELWNQGLGPCFAEAIAAQQG